MTNAFIVPGNLLSRAYSTGTTVRISTILKPRLIELGVFTIILLSECIQNTEISACITNKILSCNYGPASRKEIVAF